MGANVDPGVAILLVTFNPPESGDIHVGILPLV